MDRSYTREFLQAPIEKVDRLIERYMKEMDENDEKEEQEIDRSKVQEAVSELKAKKEKLEKLQDKMKESKMTEISLTVPEARQMKAYHGVDVCYNCHIAVEAGKHFIVGYSADNSTNDYWSVVPLAEESKKLLSSIEISADKGHFSLSNLKDLSELGIKAYIPEAKKGRPKRKNGIPEEELSKEHFVYNPQDDTYTCPKGSRMHYRFLWPEVKTGTRNRVYSTDDCMSCPFKDRCTTSVRGRWITRWVNEEIEEEHWERMKKEGREKMIMRKNTVEHPFGTIKRAMNQGYFLMKGLKKVAAEFGLSVLAYNIKRAISEVGVRALCIALA